MKIETVRLKGFIGIKKGLGLDEVELDLSKLNGLVALEGENGSSKTTVLENMQPFRMMASRASSLAHHVFLKDSLKELSFQHEGNQYRTLVKVDAQSGKSEGFVWKNGHSEIDGKVTNYDQYMVSLFGTPTLFFNSVFCAQNSKKMSDLTTGQMKELFSEFLRLDQYKAFEGTSRQCVVLLESNTDSYTSQIDGKKEQLDELEKVLSQKEITKEVLTIQAEKKALLQKDLKDTQAQLEEAKNALVANEMHRKRVTELEVERTKAREQLETETAKMKKELDELRDKARNLGAEIKQCDKVLAEKERILGAVEKVETLTKELEETRKGQEKFHKARTEVVPRMMEVEGRITEEKGRLFALKTDAEASRLEMELKNCREKMADLLKRDPECESSTCSFIKGALEASNQVPEIEKAIKEREAVVTAERVEIESQIETLKKEHNELGAKLAKIDVDSSSIKRLVVSLTADLTIAKKEEARKTQLDVAEARKKDLEKLRKEVIEQGTKLSGERQERTAELKKHIETRDEQIEGLKKQIDLDSEEIKSKLEIHIQAIEGEIADKDGKLEILRKQLAVLEEKESQKTAIEDELKRLMVGRDRIINEAAEWTYLKNACSKDGLRALEIDGVAPAITGHANDLLSMSFANNFMVKLQTQDPEGRETLDIVVVTEDGEEVLLGNLSGGERVWILKALRLGMTLISIEKSGRNFRCLLADEEDGALSVENATSFVALYRSAMSLGGIESCFYVSHKPQAVAMADYRLVFGDGGIVIE